MIRTCNIDILIEYRDTILCYISVNIAASAEQYMWHVVNYILYV